MMAVPAECTRFGPEEYAALGDALLLGEEVPADLRPLWDHARACPDCLGRVEEERLRSDQLRDTLLRRAPAAEASLALAVVLTAQRLSVEVRRQAAWMAAARVDTLARSKSRGGPPAVIVTFADFALQLEAEAGSVTVTVLSRDRDVEGVAVRVVDAAGARRAEGVTDPLGAVRLALPPAESFQLELEWPGAGAVAPA